MSSVLSQSFPDWQHIIVNDGGDSEDIKRLVADHTHLYNGRIQVIHTNGEGMEFASNKGISHGTNELIAIHDDDDTWNERFLEKSIDYLIRHRNVPTLGGTVVHTAQIEEVIRPHKIITKKQRIVNKWLDRITIAEACGPYPWLPISFLFKRAAYNSVGPFREDMAVLGDREFNFRFLMKYDIGVIQEVLANHHVRRAASGFMANSINNMESFSLVGSVFINQLIRKEIDSGKFGQGSLILILELLKKNDLNSGSAAKIVSGLLGLPGLKHIAGILGRSK
jgi:glycosyltransferase involved in cell wall biosynthesis